MKTKNILDLNLEKYPVEYITRSLLEHGVELDFMKSPAYIRNPPSEEWHRKLWLALREAVADEKCLMFALHHWPSILTADPLWSPHQTSMWDSVVDVCNGGFPGCNPYKHYEVIAAFVPLLSSPARAVFKRDIFNTWSATQWNDFFQYLSGSGFNYKNPEHSLTIIQPLQECTDCDLSPFVADFLLERMKDRSSLHSKPWKDFGSTSLGQKVREHLLDPANTIVPILLAEYSIDEHNYCYSSKELHSIMHNFIQYTNLPVDPLLARSIVRSFIHFLGHECYRPKICAQYKEQKPEEYAFIAGIWNALSPDEHYQSMSINHECDIRHIRSLAALLELGLVNDLCNHLTTEQKDYLSENWENFPNLHAHVQSLLLHSVVESELGHSIDTTKKM